VALTPRPPTDPKPAGPPGGAQPGGPQHTGLPHWWFALITLLVAWNVIAFFTHPGPEAIAIPYTTLLTQVSAGNVANVQLNGDQISGTFAKPYAARPEPSASPVSYTAFHTTYPQTIGDPGLMPLLETHHVTVDVAATAPSWLGALLAWLPALLLFAFFIFMAQRAGSGAASSVFGFGRAKPQRYSSDQPKVTFDDVANAAEAKAELEEEVDFLKHPAKYHALGAHIPKGVLLVGPPGTGKTLLARAVAGEAGVPFFSLNASEFVEMFVGVGASRVRDLFDQAKKAAPAIIFIDEIDAVGGRRGAGVGAVNDEREQTLNQLLGELDGFDPRINIIVLAATNRADVLDPALLRPGRFDRQVTVDVPDRDGREGVLRIHMRDLRLAPDVDVKALAGMTMGMSGADLANLCNEAALGAARHDHTSVTMADFEEALDKLRLGAAHPQLLDPEDRRVVAYHESGHTVVAWLTPGADPVQKVTITPHGQALGLTEQLPERERLNLSEAYLKTRLAVMLGGRTAEELVFGEPTTGAENDLVQATSLARQMVTTWGMGSLGLIAFKSDESQPFLGYELSQNREYSEATAAQIDQDIERLLGEAHQTARTCLSGARPQLDQLVDALLRDETVRGPDLTRILGPQRTTAVSA
jgi:cell division protease FtsH